MLISCVAAFITQWRKDRDLKSTECTSLCNIQVHTSVFSQTLTLPNPKCCWGRLRLSGPQMCPAVHTRIPSSTPGEPPQLCRHPTPTVSGRHHTLTSQSDWGTSYKPQVARARGDPAAHVWCTQCVPAAADSLHRHQQLDAMGYSGYIKVQDLKLKLERGG